MGVPRFYRWLSERYPCIMQNYDPNNCPEYDNLYLDMNGIIHVCSHPSDDVHFRLPEDVIFQNIVLYVDHLFNMIMPRKVLFLSVDGVAPRSKMNQQRSRRYKSAKEAIEKEAEALENDEELPKSPRFDSNCITPGTEFMAKLHSYMLEEFAKRVQNNILWQDIEVIYSGFDVPGEGEHKIMDYIRFLKTRDLTQKEAIRHCLYGLDADLISLGLSSHEPYFSILREEVKFGWQNFRSQNYGNPQKTNFQFLHLSILRDYIDAEFHILKSKLKKIPYQLKNIIDDWILLNFFIGNDFLPHVPMFHVEKNSLEILYRTYIKVLPTLDGYLNIDGEIQLNNFNQFLIALSDEDFTLYKKRFLRDDQEMLLYGNAFEEIMYTYSSDMSSFFSDSTDCSSSSSCSESSLSSCSESSSSSCSDSSSSSFSESSSFSCSESSSSSFSDDFPSPSIMFIAHRKLYYHKKLNFTHNTLSKKIVDFSNEYIRGLQWVLYYYYRGCPSWNWFFPYYYSPYVTDLTCFDIEQIKFKLNKPFPPLVQLVAVLPAESKTLLPAVFQRLIGNKVSPLTRFFPDEVEIDYNEKRQDYEALVLLPFVDENIIMKIYNTYKIELNDAEKRRNVIGFHYSMIYSVDVAKGRVENFTERFPNVNFVRHDWKAFILDWKKIVFGLRRHLDSNAFIGFPTLKNVPFIHKLSYARLRINDFISKNLTMMINIWSRHYSSEFLQDLLNKFSGQSVFINWPYYLEAKLLEIMDCSTRYLKISADVQQLPNTKDEWSVAYQGSSNYFYDLFQNKGIIYDRPMFIAKVLKLESERYVVDKENKAILRKNFAEDAIYVPLDFLVYSEERLNKPTPQKDLQSIFIPGRWFFVHSDNYFASRAHVLSYVQQGPFSCIKASVTISTQPNFDFIDNAETFQQHFLSEDAFITEATVRFCQPQSSIEKIISSVIVCIRNADKMYRVNIGLKLRYQRKSLPGYSKIVYYDDQEYKYYFDRKCFDIIQKYYETFPEIFDIVQNYNILEQLDLDDCLPDKTERYKIDLIYSMKAWIDDSEHLKWNHMPSSTDYLESCVIDKVEKYLQAFQKKESVVETCLTPRELFIPELIVRNDVNPNSNAHYHVYDRVINIKKNCLVPFGMSGTVIGIYSEQDLLDKHSADRYYNDNPDDCYPEKVIEVLFDEPFPGAISNRSEKPSVFYMKQSWMINVTFGTLFRKQTFISMPKRSVEKTEAMPENTFQTNASTLLKKLLNISFTENAASPATKQQSQIIGNFENNGILSNPTIFLKKLLNISFTDNAASPPTKQQNQILGHLENRAISPNPTIVLKKLLNILDN